MARGGISGLAVAMGTAGLYLVYAGIRNVPLLAGLRDLAQGRLPAPGPQTPTPVRFDTNALGAIIGAGAQAGAGAVNGAGSGTGIPTSPGGPSYDLGAVKPHVKAAAYELGHRFGIKKIIGWAVGEYDHPRGLALDFMTTSGQALADYAVANHVRLKVHYVIWNHRVWNTDRIADGWHPYTDTPNPHTDHVHVSFHA